VIVDLAERHARDLGDAAGREVRVALLEEALTRGVEDRGARLGRRPVATLRPGARLLDRPVHALSIRRPTHGAIE
jgi:hypothetical protein